ncbi:MAG TPA: alkaline phosphatase family protein, partial [Polyangiaceae bacterium]|nr:alkaline phosphatase family protein [Polyangiaceae bacterium]
ALAYDAANKRLYATLAGVNAVEENRNLEKLPGRPEIQCPAGADDFPIPKDTSSGPSKQIKHVILVIRENKTYDAIFGDRADLGDGDKDLIMAGDLELQKKLWQNARLIAEQFTNFDNFYTAAEQSIQGHTWTVYGRTNDFMERAWLTVWGRGTRALTTPLTKPAIPEEGGVFDWLANNGIDYDNMGEIIGGGPNGPDPAYPGLIYAQNRPDIDKSCYMAGRIRVLCNLKPFTYAVQSNDHTYGGAPNAAAPEVMIAVNDEATGMLLDALSHSPIWQNSLLIVTEDDPQDGGDHVDLHRTMLLMASPWIRRKYVSHGHYDMASVYKLIAHIYGIPYNNESIKSALLPADAFTSTPDFTPYTYVPRDIDAPCNSDDTAEAAEAKGWDFEDIDDQPGLSQQIMRMLKQPRAARGVRVVKPAR